MTNWASPRGSRTWSSQGSEIIDGQLPPIRQCRGWLRSTSSAYGFFSTYCGTQAGQPNWEQRAVVSGSVFSRCAVVRSWSRNGAELASCRVEGGKTTWSTTGRKQLEDVINWISCSRWLCLVRPVTTSGPNRCLPIPGRCRQSNSALEAAFKGCQHAKQFSD
jgi:hypothetical protein